MNNEVATGYFLRLTPKEEEDFRLFMVELEYTPDSEGLRKFILDSIYEEEEPEKVNPLLNVLTENPEMIKTGFKFVHNKLNEKLFGKK